MKYIKLNEITVKLFDHRKSIALNSCSNNKIKNENKYINTLSSHLKNQKRTTKEKKAQGRKK